MRTHDVSTTRPFLWLGRVLVWGWIGLVGHAATFEVNAVPNELLWFLFVGSLYIVVLVEEKQLHAKTLALELRRRERTRGRRSVGGSA